MQNKNRKTKRFLFLAQCFIMAGTLYFIAKQNWFYLVLGLLFWMVLNWRIDEIGKRDRRDI